jgi:hypothetical protein
MQGLAVMHSPEADHFAVTVSNMVEGALPKDGAKTAQVTKKQIF